MNPALRELLRAIEQECDEADKSTEYLMQRLQDAVRVWNDKHGCDLDTFDTMMDYMNSEATP